MRKGYLLHQLVREAAAASPAAPAVVDGERTLTYAELDSRSDQVANLLVSLGVERGDRVGLYLDKSAESVVGIYGAMKAGAAYVPLDPMAPSARVAYITRDCGIRCLVTAKAKAPAWAELTSPGSPVEELIVLDGDATGETTAGTRHHGAAELDRQPASSPDVDVIDLDLAYILYTSGSTGAPKGVKLTHLNALGFVNWAVEEFAVTAADRLSSHAPFHFDLSVFDLYAAAHAGASLVLVPARASIFPIEIARFIDRHRITVWYSVPSVLTMMVLRGGLKQGSLPSLRTLLFAGEVFPTKYLQRLTALVPHVRFANLYGPTETNVCTWYEVPPLSADDLAPIPIGRAIADVECFAVTDAGERAAPGEVGELYVRGCTVMQGYWGDADRTDRVLVPNPFGREVRDPAYRTGDLVQEDEKGDFRYLGRRDSQIKSRGYRIELGEIETALHAHPSVVECAVLPVPDDLVTNRIKAFVVVRDTTGGPDLAQFCSQRIPHYMVPETFELRAALAKTSTGKIDRQALASEAAAPA